MSQTDNSDKSKSRVQSKTDSKPWFLYMIRCAKGQLYTGVTVDIERRFSEHQAGGIKTAKFLRGKGPLTLVYRETLTDRSAALKREIAVKKLTRPQKLALIGVSQHSS